MIWLWSNLWWLVPVLIGVAALAHPIPRAVLGRVPLRWWLYLGVVAILGLTFQCGRWYERSVAREAAVVAEKKADVKAAGAYKKADEDREAVTSVISKESADAVAQVRTIIRTIPATCPDMPPELRELLQRQVEAANAGLPAKD